MTQTPTPDMQPWQVPADVANMITSWGYARIRYALGTLPLQRLEEVVRAVEDEQGSRYHPARKPRMARQKEKPENPIHPRRVAAQTAPDIVEHIPYGLAQGKKYHLTCFASSLEKEMSRYWERPGHSHVCRANEKCAACHKPLKQKAKKP